MNTTIFSAIIRYVAHGRPETATNKHFVWPEMKQKEVKRRGRLSSNGLLVGNLHDEEEAKRLNHC